jgi:hypothetical protein
VSTSEKYMNLVPTALQIPWCQRARLLPPGNVNLLPIIQAGFTNSQSAPTKVFGIVVISSDSAARDLQISIGSSGVFFVLGTVTIPASSGIIGTVPSVSLLNSIPAFPLDETGQAYLFMNPTDTLSVRATTALTAASEIDIVSFGADF